MNYTEFRVIMNVFPVLAVEEIEKEGNSMLVTRYLSNQ